MESAPSGNGFLPLPDRSSAGRIPRRCSFFAGLAWCQQRILWTARQNLLRNGFGSSATIDRGHRHVRQQGVGILDGKRLHTRWEPQITQTCEWILEKAIPIPHDISHHGVQVGFSRLTPGIG